MPPSTSLRRRTRIWFYLLLRGLSDDDMRGVIRGTDEGIWRRIHLVPFEVTIAQEARDPNLFDKLKAELPGILNWAIAGCRDWQAHGLCPPAAVTGAVADYVTAFIAAIAFMCER